MDTGVCRLFCDLVELKKMTLMAGKYGITQSAVSQRLKNLEKEIGTILFERTGDRSLTETGKAVLHACKAIAAIDDQLQATLELLRK